MIPLAKKIQSFFVRKIESDRLKDNNYNLDLGLDEARNNKEIVSLADCQVLRSLRYLRGEKFDPQVLAELQQEKKKLKRKEFSPENQTRLLEIFSRIDNILFEPNVVQVTFNDKRHYKTAAEKGFEINGIKYKRLLCSAGMARKNTVQFVNEQYERPLKNLLNAGRKNIPIVPAKLNSYFGLYSSSTQIVSYPNFVVIPDFEYSRMMTVDYMDEEKQLHGDYVVEEREIEQKINAFDGQGLVLPYRSKLWANELELDWTPATWIFRMPFGKGQLVTFDFLEYANKVKKYEIVDVWGKEHDVRNVDVIFSASQIKLSSAFESGDDYLQKCLDYRLDFGISRYSPKESKTYSFATYQFLQTLNVTKPEQIASLCQDTVEWLRNISGQDYLSSILFLLGDLINSKDVNCDILDKIDNPVLKCLLLEPEIIKDGYVRKNLFDLINKKIRESYMGVLLLNGANYQPIIADPVAQIQFALGEETKGLLKEHEHYSNYWNIRNVNKVSALRAPMIWRSENNILNFRNSRDMNYWYQYLYDGVVFNIWGDDSLRMSGQDFDGDICLTTNQKEFVDGSFGGNVISYNRKTAQKTIPDESTLWKYDLDSFNSKIGFITNISTGFWSLMGKFNSNSKEYQALVNRQKSIFCYQSMEIDKTKGIEIVQYPKHWSMWNKNEGDSEVDFLNRIVLKQKPYFFRWLYPKYNKKYRRHIDNYDNYCWAKFGCGFWDLTKKDNRNENEQTTVEKFYQYSPLLDTPCIMNDISHYMEGKVKELRWKSKSDSPNYERIVGYCQISPESREQIKSIEKKFRSYHASECDDFTYLDIIRKDIFLLEENWETILGYLLKHHSRMAFICFGGELAELLKQNGCLYFPTPNEDGTMYLGKRYSLTKIKL